MTVIGLTGNSGSGKSSVAKIMKKYGAVILDCDKIAHENMSPEGCAYDDIVKYFGNEILNTDKTINRRVLGSIVFNDREKLQVLNNITHSRICDRVKSEISKAKNACVVIDAPLLIEAGLDSIAQKIWVVTADQEVRIARIMERDGISRKDVLSRFSRQTPESVLKEKADLIIDHSENNFEKLENEIYNYMKIEGLLNV